jgi:hypothetical protein
MLNASDVTFNSRQSIYNSPKDSLIAMNMGMGSQTLAKPERVPVWL